MTATDDRVRLMVVESTARSGVPEKVEDPTVLARVARMLQPPTDPAPDSLAHPVPTES